MNAIDEYVMKILTQFACMDQSEILEGEFLSEYFGRNLLFMTVHLHVDKAILKDDRLLQYGTDFRKYYFRLCDHMFDGKIRKNKSKQPLAIGFYDQEGTRQRLNYKIELKPHIHCLLLFKNNTIEKFRSCFSERNNYELPGIKEACFLNTKGDSSERNLISYCSKYANIRKENLFSPFFEVLPDFLKDGRDLRL